ncbi:hypothetical protein [Desulfonema ishimotonii]|nr:hypothetical protein [Desulfonema ishimotonii]
MQAPVSPARIVEAPVSQKISENPENSAPARPRGQKPVSRSHTGPMHPACDMLKNVRFAGTLVPHSFHRHIRRESGTTDFEGVGIMSDILYHYRPAEIRDRKTGRITGYRQRFRGDKFQISYRQYAEHYGISKGQVTTAVKNPDRLGLVFREIHDGCPYRWAQKDVPTLQNSHLILREKLLPDMKNKTRSSGGTS